MMFYHGKLCINNIGFPIILKLDHMCAIMIDFLVFNSTFSNISAISWQPVLVVEEAGVPEENHRPWTSNW
jgi:hypothetical protein